MARISYETFQETANSYEGGDNVEFFSLKNHGDEAVVRIMHDSVEDFDIMTTHPVKIGNFWRKVNCIRDPREPMDNCPLCKAGQKIQQRFFIHMIQYVKDPATNQVTAKPVVWERAASEYATKLKTLIENYGPLSNCIFKIHRNGQSGSMETTYELMFGNPSIYTEELYPKSPDAFKGYSALGRVVMDKTVEEMNAFLATGNFPMRQTQNNVQMANAPQVTAPPPVYTPQTANPAPAPQYPPVTPAPAEVPSSPAGYPPQTAPTSAPNEVPWGTTPSTAGAPARPTRYY